MNSTWEYILVWLIYFTFSLQHWCKINSLRVTVWFFHPISPPDKLLFSYNTLFYEVIIVGGEREVCCGRNNSLKHKHYVGRIKTILSLTKCPYYFWKKLKSELFYLYITLLILLLFQKLFYKPLYRLLPAPFARMKKIQNTYYNHLSRRKENNYNRFVG